MTTDDPKTSASVPPVNGDTHAALSTPAPRPSPTPNQIVLAYLLVIALVALASVVIGLLTSRLVGIGVFSVVLLFTITYRAPSKTRAHRAPAPPPAAPLPAARIEVRGVVGHAQRAGAKLKHATITALAVIVLIGAFVGVRALAAWLKGPRRATALEQQIEDQRRQDAERRMWEERCPGMSAQACKDIQPMMREIEERRRRLSTMTVDELTEESRRTTEELRRKYPQYMPPPATSEPLDVETSERPDVSTGETP